MCCAADSNKQVYIWNNLNLFFVISIQPDFMMEKGVFFRLGRGDEFYVSRTQVALVAHYYYIR